MRSSSSNSLYTNIYCYIGLAVFGCINNLVYVISVPKIWTHLECTMYMYVPILSKNLNCFDEYEHFQEFPCNFIWLDRVQIAWLSCQIIKNLIIIKIYNNNYNRVFYIALSHVQYRLQKLHTLLFQKNNCIILFIYPFSSSTLQHTVPMAVNNTSSGFNHPVHMRRSNRLGTNSNRLGRQVSKMYQIDSKPIWPKPTCE